MKSRCLLALALAGACGLAPIGWAAEPLRLEDAIARALAANPALAAESAELQALQARAWRDALPTPYVLGADVENVAGTGPLRGMRSAETTLRIGRTLELGGKRAARAALGEAELAHQQHMADAARVDIESRTRTRHVDVLADQERLKAAHEQVALAERTRREVAGWVAAARNPESDLRAAEIALAEAELEREHAEHELASARTTLAAMWGVLAPDFEAVDGALLPLPQVDAFETLTARLPESSAQRAVRLEAERIAARRRLAEAGAAPDLQLSLGVRRLEALDTQGLMVSLSVPLGSRRRAGFSLAEADAELAAFQARREAERIELHRRLFEIYQELLHARTEYESLRTAMIPKAEQALAFNRRGFEAGRFSFLSVAEAQTTLFALRTRRIDAAARYHSLLIEVQRLVAAVPEIAS